MMAGERGLEPRYAPSKGAVLPLNDSPMVQAAWNRTRVSRIKSPMLSQLSYACANAVGSGAESRTLIARVKTEFPKPLEDTAAVQRWRLGSRWKVEAPAGLESAHCPLRRGCSTSELQSRFVVPSDVMTLVIVA